MDNLSHTLLGVHIARFPWDRFSRFEAPGPRLAMGTSLVASNLPDADAILWALGDAAYLFGHRTATHSLVGLLLLAPLVALVACLLGRRPLARAFVPLLLLSAVAQAGHLLLDLPTSWGTVLFWPISDLRLAVPWLFIVDPVVWAILGLPLLRDAIRRRAGRASSGAGRSRTAGWAVATLALYVAICGNLHARARVLAVEDALAAEGGPLENSPTARIWAAPGGPLLWTAAVRTDHEAWRRSFVSVLTGGITPAGSFPTGLTDARVQVALETPVGRRYAWFADAPYLVWATPLEEDGSFEVLLGDLRFTNPFSGMNPFQLWVRVGPQFQQLGHEIRTGSVPPEPDSVARLGP